MNAGLSNLGTLKAWLLPASLTGTDYDAQVLGIGLGVAAQLERHCVRDFARTVGATHECDAARRSILVRRFPIEEVTDIDLREAGAAVDAWSEQSLGEVDQIQHDSGLIELAGPFGSWRDRLRITYTGGYWWNQQESAYTPPVTPTDEDPDLSVIPEGAKALPADLLLAWKLQCEHVWAQRDKLGTNIGAKPGSAPSLALIELLPVVKEILRTYIRYDLV